MKSITIFESPQSLFQNESKCEIFAAVISSCFSINDAEVNSEMPY